MAEVKISVDGRPPKKSEAYSLLNEKHPKAFQVLALLEAVLAVVGPDFAPYTGPVGVEVILWAPDDRDLGDATNYLGGIGDVLQTKNPKRNPMTHLGDLTTVAVFADDRQVREVNYRHVIDPRPRYQIRVYEL
jgi:hypothetical protein